MDNVNYLQLLLVAIEKRYHSTALLSIILSNGKCELLHAQLATCVGNTKPCLSIIRDINTILNVGSNVDLNISSFGFNNVAIFAIRLKDFLKGTLCKLDCLKRFTRTIDQLYICTALFKIILGNGKR